VNEVKRRTKQKGNALIEFALGAAVLIPFFVGTFAFGYGFYTYNRVQSSIANGARYASLRTYRCLSGTADIDKVKEAIRNVTVYGEPNKTADTKPLVNELTTENVVVAYQLNGLNEPMAVTVRANNVKINAVFTSFMLRQKPAVTFPFIGRYAPEESEP